MSGMGFGINLTIAHRGIFASGLTFGASGAYESVVGRVQFAVDPESPPYRSVVDIAHAPRRLDGRVEYATDIYILKPVDMALGNRRIFYDVCNRGMKIALQFMNEAEAHEEPYTIAHAGNGYLMRRGYTIVWSGWQADVLPLDRRLTIDVPTATANGRPITGLVRTEFAPGVEETGESATQSYDGRRGIFCIPLSGNPHTRSYQSVSLDTETATLTYREYETDRRKVISPGDWAFSRLMDNATVSPSGEHCFLPAGFRPGWIYELIYTARDPLVMGLGHTGVRDWLTWLRFADYDDAGVQNPVRENAVDIEHVYGWGCSQSARFLREFVYAGHNETIDGRSVFDGISPFVAGAGRIYLNHRFAQPGRYPRQQYDRLYWSDDFPFAYPVTTDPLTGRTDGILKRPTTDPYVIHTQSSAEYWQRRASLVHTSANGEDLEDDAKVRMYLFAATEHAPYPGTGPEEGVARYLTNPLKVSAFLRAMQDHLDMWVSKGIVPPDSEIPRVRDGTLVPIEAVTSAFPVIPDVFPPATLNRLYVQDHGKDFVHGIGDIEPPHEDHEREYTLLVPAIDLDGNERVGVIGPELAVPLGTYTGWNYQLPGQAQKALNHGNGSFFPFAITEDLRLSNDSRKSINARYTSLDDYLARIVRAIEELVENRLILEEDVDKLIVQAREAYLTLICCN